MDPKKRGAFMDAMLGGGKKAPMPGEGPGTEEEAPAGDDQPLRDAVTDLFSAMKSGDVDGGMDAIKAAVLAVGAPPPADDGG